MRRRMWGLVVALRYSDAGQAYVEYVVLGALAVLVILGAVQIFFGAISALFVRLAEVIQSAF